MSGMCSQKKSNGLFSYFTRLEPPKIVSPTNGDGRNEEPLSSVASPEMVDNEVEIGRGVSDEQDEVEKDITSGGKRKRSYTKRGTRQSNESKLKTLRQRHHSDTAPKYDSDSDFEQKEVVKRPKRKFTSVPNGVKSISSYFASSNGGSQPSTECSMSKSNTEDIEIVEELNISEHKSDIEIVEELNISENKNAVEIVEELSSSENKNNVEVVEELSNSELTANKVEIGQLPADTPTRRRSSRIQNLEEKKEKELEDKKRQAANTKSSRSRKRQQISDSESGNSVAVQSESDESSDFIDSEDEDHFQKRRKGKRKSKTVNGKIPLMFLTGKERERELLRLKKEKEKPVFEFDAATLAFLQSGVPDVVLKAQKQVEKKQEIDEYLSTVGFFPKISHTEVCVSEKSFESFGDLCFNFKENIDESVPSCCSWNEFFDGGTDIKNSITLDNGKFCCGNTSFVRFNSALDVNISLNSEMPWFEKYKVGSKKDLVVDKEAFGKLERWLKQWKTDIKDDGGTGRKEIKKRRKDSDSDFVTSDEDEHDFMNKSVLLCGSTGCGKTTSVYVLAKHLGFYVVEVNFSSRRSGKEVMQSVEEATLSHRLESSESCLLLFKDVDLVHPEEDEGFHAAVAQLISSSCRPIVMTTQEPIYTPLDSKIEKKNPLRIYFERPLPLDIVEKVLVPMCKSSVSDRISIDEKLLVSGLDSLVRHLHCDIRLSINQTQFLCFDNFFTPQNIHKHCHLIENCIDLDFVSKSKKDKLPQQDTKVDKKKLLNDLNKLSKDLSLLGDIELLSSKYKSCNDHRDEVISTLAMNFREHFEQASKIPEFLPKDNFNNKDDKIFGSYESRLDCYRKLSLVNDKEDLLSNQSGILSEELSSYCDDFDDWQSRGCVRTIVKSNAINSVGRSAKRNGRMAFYFNRLDKGLVNRICSTFGFAQELEIAKIFAPS